VCCYTAVEIIGDVVSSCQPMRVPLPSDVVMVRECRCGHDGSVLVTDVASVLACGNNEHNKLGLNQRQGFLMAMKNIFNKVPGYVLLQTCVMFNLVSLLCFVMLNFDLQFWLIISLQ